jgi:hypothetical protein
MQRIVKSLVVFAAVLLMSFAVNAAAQEGQAAANAAESTSGSGASSPASVSPEGISELQAEVKQLRMLLEQQQEQIAKLKAGTPSTVESANVAQPAPAPAPAPAAREEDPVRPLRIGGFASWAYGKANNINEFDLATQHGRYDNIDAGLIVSVGITSSVNAVAQFSFQSADDHTETDVDFAFLDWKVTDKFNLRAGQNKNPFGLYGEYFGIGTAYPFNNVPQSIYGGTAIGNEFYRGVGGAGRAFLSQKWELDYDLFFGGLLNDELNPAERTSDAILAGQPTVSMERGSEEIRQAFGGRVMFARPDNGLKFGITGSAGISPDKGRNNILGAFASFDTVRWMLRSEIGHSYEPGFINFTGAYLEAGYKIKKHWQPVFRYDWARQHLNTLALVPEQLKHHREVAGGLNYWVTAKAVVKGSYHHIEGNLLSLPRGDLSVAGMSTLPKSTDVATIGMSLVF